MHELSVAQEIARTVLKLAFDKGAKRITRIEVEVGKLTFLGIDQLRFWLEACLEGTIGSGSKLIFREIDPVVRCRSCGYEGGIKEVEVDLALHLMLPSIECPACGSAEVEIVSGRDCLIRRVELSI